MRNVLVVASLALAVVVWNGVSAQQEMLPRPGPGSGLTKVVGSVTIDALPDVHANQRGPWRVGVTDLPDVRVAAPWFLRDGSRYEITWTNGDQESVTIAATGSDGWIQVERTRWVNLGSARSVKALP